MLQKLFDAIVDGKAQARAIDRRGGAQAGAEPWRSFPDDDPGDGRGRQALPGGGVLRPRTDAGRTGDEGGDGAVAALARGGGREAGRVVVAGAVKGDLHDIGKNLVISMLEGASFKVIDLGTDVTPEKFVEAILSTIHRSSACPRC